MVERISDASSVVAVVVLLVVLAVVLPAVLAMVFPAAPAEVLPAVAAVVFPAAPPVVLPAVLFAVLPAAPLIVLLTVPVELTLFDPFVDEEAFLFEDTIFAAESEAEFPVFSKVPAEQPLNVTAAISAIILTIFIFMVESPFIFYFCRSWLYTTSVEVKCQSLFSTIVELFGFYF